MDKNTYCVDLDQIVSKPSFQFCSLILVIQVIFMSF